MQTGDNENHSTNSQLPTPPPSPAPLPRPLLGQSSKTRDQSTSPVSSKSLDKQLERTMATTEPAVRRLEMSVYSWEPCYFFFYGSLMDTEVIQAVTGSQEEPVLRSGYIEGFQMKMWSIYPTLVPKEGHRVQGQAWRIEKWDTFNRLQRYETNHYAPYSCTIHLDDGEVLENSRVFCWAGEPDSGDLEDGKFDLEHYRKYFKPSLFGKR